MRKARGEDTTRKNKPWLYNIKMDLGEIGCGGVD
jgi:hypothetical protein